MVYNLSNHEVSFASGVWCSQEDFYLACALMILEKKLLLALFLGNGFRKPFGGGCLLSEHLPQVCLRVAGPCFHVSVYDTQAMTMISQSPALKSVVENFPRECITNHLTPWLASLQSPPAIDN